MSTIAQRIHRAQMPGYWAVEIRQSAAAGPGKQYLCQAQDDHAAAAIAGRLMGSDLSVRGFNYYWIEKDLLDRTGATLPPLDQHQEVTGPEAWTALMAAHRASELAAAAERGWRVNGALRRGPGSTFRVSETSEGWQVTHGEAVYGDFQTRGDAVRAACFGARAQDRRGGRSEVRVMPGDEREPVYEPHFGE